MINITNDNLLTIASERVNYNTIKTKTDYQNRRHPDKKLFGNRGWCRSIDKGLIMRTS